MNKQKIGSVVKAVVGTTSSIGIGMIVANVIEVTTPPGTKLLSKLCINMGGAGISGYVAAKVAAFTDVTIDAVFNPSTEEDPETIVVTETVPEANEKDSE